MNNLTSPTLKKEKRIYWITTIIAMIMTVGPALLYFTNDYLIETMRNRLGFPDYFRVELAIGKYLGAIALLVPAIPKMFKEWAYVAFGIVLISGSIAHGLIDGFAAGISPLVPFAILSVSYYYFRKLNYAD
ncbi:hypothetical protein BBI01_17915 [Chryseobacterium artocarpi]|uniref:DoxX-like family protein n=1 Tax=Chryseobacterium artocarpi TaxID=1414727 RepID=A0A1B8ZBW2_9FLAO|nr:DoxX family protein [Chryseobacterium artocarpi]OCA69089.1 hypothetical protein BBI01_17915 [Chryseobacterium artocarpi]